MTGMNTPDIYKSGASAAPRIIADPISGEGA